MDGNRQCAAVAGSTNERCRKDVLPASKYCWNHTDRKVKAGFLTLIPILGLASTWAIFAFQQRTPELSVTCQLATDKTPCRIDCVAQNTGRAVARDVAIGFKYILPLDTAILAAPDLRISLQESDVLAHPNLESAKHMRAFTVHIPVVPSKKTAEFSLITTSEDNQRACQQLTRLRTVMHSILVDFQREVLARYSSRYAHAWPLELVELVEVKRDCLFQPDYFAYEGERKQVEFESAEEKSAAAKHGEIYAAHKREFIDVFQDRGEYMAPVFTVKQSNGTATFGAFPPYIKTYTLQAVPVNRLHQDGTVQLKLVPPKKYD